MKTAELKNEDELRKGLNDEPKASVNIYLPESMLHRLAKYTLDKYRGKLHLRTQIIIRAIDEMLKKEGY